MKGNKHITPFITFLALVAVGILLTTIMWFFPANGIQVGESNISFPTFNEFFLPPVVEDTTAHDLAELFDSTIVITEIDSAIIQHKLDSLKKYRKSIQITDNAKPALYRFFDALDNAKKRKVRIMHYGDSQIEGDRITGYLRNELQKKFGGYGGGLFPIIQVAKKGFVNTEYSENWIRYTGFGRKDSTVTHKKYGALMNFSRFVPIHPEETINDSLEYEAWIKIKKPTISYGKTKSYLQLKVFYSNMLSSIDYEIVADEQVVSSGILSANTPFQTLQVNFKKTPNEIILNFKGKDSPDIYGISLEGNSGIVMDNIPLRGSSGTIFTKQDKTLLGNMYANLSPKLIILEFGGNVIPYIKDAEASKTYGRWFASQLRFMKRMNPSAAIIVIGPGDMSIKEKTAYVTHPQLENVRDALKEATLNSDAIFWDMYETMGGKNSMPKWVDAEPALAAKDYIHFSRKGAKKIAEDFYTKLIKLYDEYKNPTKEPQEEGEEIIPDDKIKKETKTDTLK